MNSGRSIAGGFLWTGGTSYVSQAVTIVTTLLLAKYVPVADLGIFSLAGLVVGWLALVRGLGLGTALIYEQQDVQKASATTFWLLLATGVLLTALSFLAAPLAARLFHNPSIEPVVQVLGLSFIFYGLMATQDTLLQKGGRFRTRALAGLAGTVVYAVLAVVLAIQGFGVWSLVYAQIAQTVSIAAAMWAVSPFRPSFQFDRAVARRLLRFGNFALLNDVLIFVILTLDRAVLGRVTSALTVGYYDFAYRLANYPPNAVTAQLYPVILPVYSRLQSQPAELKRVYLATIKHITYLTAFLAFAIVLLGPPFLRLLYGDKWVPAIPPLQVLAVYGLTTSIAGPTGSVFYGLGKPNLQVIIHVLKLAATFPALYFIAVSYGVMGATLYVTGVNLLFAIVSVIWTNRLLGIHAGEYLQSIAGPMTLGAAIASIGLLASFSLPLLSESIPGFALLAVGFAAAYVGLLLLLDTTLRSRAAALAAHPRQTIAGLLAEGERKG
ncbi:MAG: lipopolysaccharide biosynthesis protein [Chloroflexi bacterium]|nr:lipopolysaccharide biosynthesis protein [Chloroflexota bacterium]